MTLALILSLAVLVLLCALALVWSRWPAWLKGLLVVGVTVFYFFAEDLDVQEQGFLVESASFQLQLPIEGEMSYDLGTDTADGAPLTLAGSIEIPASAGDLATFEMTATMHSPSTPNTMPGMRLNRSKGVRRNAMPKATKAAQ